jgi:hypothetical protein
MAEDAPPPEEDATLKRKDPPADDDDSDEEEAATRARRPRGARSAVRPGVECPYMDTISRQVRAVCGWSVYHTPLMGGDARLRGFRALLCTIRFSALTCCGPGPARSATERLGPSTVKWPLGAGVGSCQPRVGVSRVGATHTARYCFGSQAVVHRVPDSTLCMLAAGACHSRFPPSNPDVAAGVCAAHSCWTLTLRSAAPSTWHPSTSTHVWSAASTTRCVGPASHRRIQKP